MSSDKYEKVTYNTAKTACCEAMLYVMTTGRAPAVFKFCDKCKGGIDEGI